MLTWLRACFCVIYISAYLHLSMFMGLSGYICVWKYTFMVIIFRHAIITLISPFRFHKLSLRIQWVCQHRPRPKPSDQWHLSECDLHLSSFIFSKTGNQSELLLAFSHSEPKWGWVTRKDRMSVTNRNASFIAPAQPLWGWWNDDGGILSMKG